jgi:hypothetical protein
MMLDRGDNSPANRLTWTDRPYVDKGVNGVKYHDTYSAPYHCIRSKLVTEEDRVRGTKIDPIVIANGDGRFDDLLQGEQLRGHRFVVLRGDQSWSLMETHFPYRFVEIFRGQVEKMRVDRGKIILECSAVKHKLDNLVASIDEPIHYGSELRNVPALLVDDATHQYRFTTKLAKHNNAQFIATDKGLPIAGLTKLAEGEPDTYFRGLVQLPSSPQGQLTAEFSSGSNGQEILQAAQQAVIDNVVSDYPVLGSSFEYEADKSRVSAFGDSEAQFYYIDHDNNRLWQRTLSSPGDVTTMGSAVKNRSVSSTDTSGFDYTALQAVSSDLICFCDATLIWEFDMTGWDIDTSTWGNSFDTTSVMGGAERCFGFQLVPEKGWLYLLDRAGIVYKLDYTPGNVGTATNAKIVLRLNPYFDNSLGDFYDFRFSPDGRFCYFAHPGDQMIFQFTCVGEFELDGAFRESRSYYLYEFGQYGPHWVNSIHVGDKDDTIYISDQYFGETATVYEVPCLEDYSLPVDLMRTNISALYADAFVGVFYNREVQAGKIITDLLGSIGAEFIVDRKGGLFASRLENPNAVLEDWVQIYDIGQSAFQGGAGEHIKHVSTQEAKRAITVRYDVNFTVQNPSDLADSVSDTNKAYRSRPYEITTVTNSLPNHVDPGDLIMDTYLRLETHAETVRDYVADLWSEDRQDYIWKTTLGWQSLLSDFGLGSVINVAEDIRHPEFSPDDRVLVTRRKCNWSDDIEELGVFK